RKVRNVKRVTVGTYEIIGFKKGSNDLPTDQSTQKVIAKVIADLTANPLATVKIEGAEVSRLEKVRDEILTKGEAIDKSGFDIRSGQNFNLVDASRSLRVTAPVLRWLGNLIRGTNTAAAFPERVRITVERPDI